MLYLTTYRSTHLLFDSMPLSDISTVHEKFYHPSKGLKIAYIENEVAIQRAKKSGMEDLIIQRTKFDNMEAVLKALQSYQYMAIKYFNSKLDDNDATLIANLISTQEELMYFSFHYSCNSCHSYRQSGNRLTDKGYAEMNQALALNPGMQICNVWNNNISSLLKEEREAILQQNRNIYVEKSPIEKYNLYKERYNILLQKYMIEDLQKCTITQLIAVPSFLTIAKSEVEKNVRSSNYIFDNVCHDLLIALEPDNIADAQRCEKLSELRTEEAVYSELLHYWNNIKHQPKKIVKEQEHKGIPFVYYPPRIFR